MKTGLSRRVVVPPRKHQLSYHQFIFKVERVILVIRLLLLFPGHALVFSFTTTSCRLFPLRQIERQRQKGPGRTRIASTVWPCCSKPLPPRRDTLLLSAANTDLLENKNGTNAVSECQDEEAGARDSCSRRTSGHSE